MGNISTIIDAIKNAEPNELGKLLNKINQNTFIENEWNEALVNAFYNEVISAINISMLGFIKNINGNKHSDKAKMQANLKSAKDYFSNAPILTNPNEENLSSEVLRSILCNSYKPVYTFDEVKEMFNISSSTLNRWLKDGWIAYTQMDGGKKKFIKHEDLMDFLNDPRIFYPRRQQ